MQNKPFEITRKKEKFLEIGSSATIQAWIY
jgi:hypothetical protein